MQTIFAHKLKLCMLNVCIRISEQGYLIATHMSRIRSDAPIKRMSVRECHGGLM